MGVGTLCAHTSFSRIAMQFASKYPFLRVQLASEEVRYTTEGHLRVIAPGKYIKFESGSFVTTDMDTIEMLLHHPSYNRMFFGPYSIEEVRSGDWEKLYEKEVKKVTLVEKEKPNVKKIVTEAQRRAAGPKITDGMVATTSAGETKVDVKDLLAKGKGEPI